MQVKCTIPVAVSIILSLKWGILCAEEHQFYFLFQWAWSFFCCHWICFIVGTANDNKVHIHVKLRNHYTWQTWTFNLWIKIQIIFIHAVKLRGYQVLPQCFLTGLPQQLLVETLSSETTLVAGHILVLFWWEIINQVCVDLRGGERNTDQITVSLRGKHFHI